MRTKWKVPLDKQYLPKSGFVTITVPANRIVQIHEPKDGQELTVKIIVKPQARVNYITGSLKNVQLEVTLKEQAQFEQTFSSVRQEQRKQVFILDGKGASVQVCGSYILKEKLCSFNVLQLHKAPQATSFVELKTVLDGTAQFDYKGLITIEQSAFGSNAHQENKNLIISDQAKALSIPSLEAYNNDVQCGHGTAVSYINKDHLFYLASRGIEHVVAKKMIVQGFIQ